jgi:hypothetical protein
MNVRQLISLITLSGLTGCAAHATLLAQDPAGSRQSLPNRGAGDLLVYSATYPQTLEQSEYPAHTNYKIASADDKVIEHVSNATGTFASVPARVSLPSGEYHVRAQYDGGRFVTVPITIESGKTTVINLDGEALPLGPAATEERVRLPDGRVVGYVYSQHSVVYSPTLRPAPALGDGPFPNAEEH